MSYQQAMRWHKKHPRGGKPQYMGFASCSGFRASISWTENDWIAYVEECNKIQIKPLKQEDMYNLTLRGRIMSNMNDENRAFYTKGMRERAIDEPNNKELDIFRT